MIHTLRAHTEFVNAVCVVPNATEGLLVLTASGKVIRAFAPLDAHDPESPRYVLEGHEKEGNRRTNRIYLRYCSGKNLATALSRHGIEPGSLISIESQILSTEPQQLSRDI